MIYTFDSMRFCYRCKSQNGNTAVVEAYAADGKGIKYISCDCECGNSWKSKKYEYYKNKVKQNKLL